MLCRGQIHWFSIINSCVTVLLLTGFLATILMRVLKNDFVKYTRDDDGEPVSLACLLDACNDWAAAACKYVLCVEE